jgi:hydrogenase maturation protein HypF
MAGWMTVNNRLKSFEEGDGLSLSEPGTKEIVSLRLLARGQVQGVGFRPFIHRLACKLGLAGWVRNEKEGVFIRIEGEKAHCELFLLALKNGALPPLARVDSLAEEAVNCECLSGFVIRESEDTGQPGATAPPDIAICRQCLRELDDPSDRRYNHPFINCTDCGPRFSLIQSLPYDRENTTMSVFPPCSLCAGEMSAPADRRFHAQANACPECGPRLSLLDASGKRLNSADPLETAAQLLREGKIVAVKGIGGYHLACAAANEEAVKRLRFLKERGNKPLVVMVQDMEAAGAIARLDAEAKALLGGPASPVLVVEKLDGSSAIAPAVTSLRTIGVMLPYTPFYYLLCRLAGVLVVTSANRSDEPTIIEDECAQRELSGKVDAFLIHNRRIHQRCDDSVLAYDSGRIIPYRIARGYTPLVLHVGTTAPEVLAVGGQLKNTFCFYRNGLACLGACLGDMESPRAFEAWLSALAKFREMHGFAPAAAAVDPHPGYITTRWAGEHFRGRIVPVQHHHAHLAACLAENGENGSVLGVVFDGQGLGSDGTLWGGEFLLGDRKQVKRIGHLRQAPLVSGETAVREPWRMACVYLRASLGKDFRLLPLPFLGKADLEAWRVLEKIAEHRRLSPPTSSAGRLFDAVAAILGLCRLNTYEGEAACCLEDIADRGEGGTYHFGLGEQGGVLVADWAPVFAQVAKDVLSGTPPGIIAARFHRAVAGAITDTCILLRRKTGVNMVALSGGVFQNRLLLNLACTQLEQESFRVITHRRLPPGDGALALGQAVVAASILEGVGLNVPGRSR